MPINKNYLKQDREIAYKIHQSGFLLEKLSDQILQNRLGLGFSQFLVMSVLVGQPKAPQKFVAASLDQTQAAVSRQVDLLADRKLIQKALNRTSRREYVLSLTPAGHRAYAQGLAALGNHFSKLLADWPAAVKITADAALDGLLFELRAQGKRRQKSRSGQGSRHR